VAGPAHCAPGPVCLLQVITWQQLGFHQKPIGLLNTEGFFDPLLAAFDAFIQEVRRSQSAAAPWLPLPIGAVGSCWQLAGTVRLCCSCAHVL
jgi:hypothetical protein